MKMNCMSLFAAFAVAAIAPLAAAQSTCCSPQGTPGCDDPTCEASVCANDPFCCSTMWDGLCSNAALSTCAVCQLDSCTPDAGDCCVAHANPGCADEACCDAVCAADPFCCNSQWDDFCVGAAVSLCGCTFASCNPDAGDCCTAHANPGCADETCCNSVCALDPFCCNTEWDLACVGSAVDLCGCPFTCPESDHDCYTQGIPGCTDTDCCALVCGADSFCCEVAWDGLCVNSAFTLCGFPPCEFSCKGTPEGEPCGEDLNGGCNVAQGGTSNCCFANGGLGCDDKACTAAVCAIDAFCCDSGWDAICAGEANTFCPDICFTLPPQFGSIACGETVCGTAWATGGTRDTDWYVLEVPGSGSGVEVTITISSQLPMVAGIINSIDCATANAIDPVIVTEFCGSATVTACIAPGTHWIFAGPNGFEGFPCESGFNQYALTIECGAECSPPACGNAGHDCFTAGGPFCDDVTCCENVCAGDAFCCEVEWDALCVEAALGICGAKCPLECTGTDEGEDCGTDENGGCNMPFPAFGEIGCNETICGTAWADGGTRDTDWFILDLASDTEITITMSSQLPMVFGVVDTVDCATATQILPFAITEYCGTAEIIVTLPAGIHWLIATPNGFSGFPCGSEKNAYSFTVTCPVNCVSGPDRNGDGCVDGQDLALVLGNWDPTGSMGNGLGIGDTNCDGVVDGFDLAPILGDWLVGCP